MRIMWRSGAVLDLDSIRAYIAKDNPAAAMRVRERIVTRVRELGRMPHTGRPGRVAGTRELVISRLPYLVAYRVEPDTIEVLAVRHGARKWPQRF